MDKTQLGRAGELALSLYALVTSGGRLELFAPVTDDDHVDLVAGLRAGPPRLAIQVKTTDRVDKSGLVEAVATYRRGEVREDRAFIYAVILLESVRIRTAWLVPSPAFNRLVYRTGGRDREVLEFRASPERDDDFASFRVAPDELGPALIAEIDGATAAGPGWLQAVLEPSGG